MPQNSSVKTDRRGSIPNYLSISAHHCKWSGSMMTKSIISTLFSQRIRLLQWQWDYTLDLGDFASLMKLMTMFCGSSFQSAPNTGFIHFHRNQTMSDWFTIINLWIIKHALKRRLKTFNFTNSNYIYVHLFHIKTWLAEPLKSVGMDTRRLEPIWADQSL